MVPQLSPHAQLVFVSGIQGLVDSQYHHVDESKQAGDLDGVELIASVS